MTTATIPQAVLAQLRAAVHEGELEPDADQRTAAYWWGKPDDAVAWWLGMCRRVAADPISQALYLAHVAEDMSHKREIKDWAYRVAAECASRARQGAKRNQPAVASYDPAWGRQAARDGLAMALWPHRADEVPGVNFRATCLGCRNDAYQYIRDEVKAKAKELIEWFRADMEQCRKGYWRRDFIDRWQDATGASWLLANME